MLDPPLHLKLYYAMLQNVILKYTCEVASSLTNFAWIDCVYINGSY